MEYKDILVSIDAGDRRQQQMKLALTLARKHKARLLGYYVSPTVDEGVDREPTNAEHPVQAADLAEAIQIQFEEDLRANGLDGTWLLSGDNIVEDVVAHIRSADLAIVGLGDPDRSGTNLQRFDPEDVILACGRPILGVPIANVPEDVGRNILIAWDGSRAATRAMHDGLPLLKPADSVTLLAIDPDERDLVSIDSAVDHLRQHEIGATKRIVSSSGSAIGDALLAECEYLHVDLVVAGAYGHSRFAESMLGGVSHRLLHQMMIPVLMSH